MPTNDSFASATAISGGSGSIAGTTVGASVEGSEPARGATNNWYMIGDQSAWYGGAYIQKWRIVTVADIPAGTTVSFPTPGTDVPGDGAMYLEIDIFTADPGDLTDANGFQGELDYRAPWADADGSNGSDTFSADVPSGTTLWVVAQQWIDASVPKEDSPPAVVWDISADILAWDHSGAIHPTPTGAFTQYPVGPSGEKTVWYAWTPAAGKKAVAVPDGFSLAVFTGSSIGALTLVDADYENDGLNGWVNGLGVGIFTADGTTTYHLRVNPYRASASGAFNLTWMPAPANDNFASAVDLGGATSGSITQNLLGSTIETDEPDPNSYGFGGTIWFKWTAPSNSLIQFFSDDSDTDVAIHVYTGTSLSGGLALIVGSRPASYNLDQTSAGGFAFHAHVGTVYWIRIMAGRGATRDVTWSWVTLGPSNDDFANAIDLDTSTDLKVICGGATYESAEPDPILDGGSSGFIDLMKHNTVWFKWVAPSADPITVSSAGEIGWVDVLVGTTLAGLTVLNDDDGVPTFLLAGSLTSFTFTPTPGTTYWIRSGVYSPFGDYGQHDGAIGTVYGFTVPPAPPVNDNRADAIVLTGDSGDQTYATLLATSETDEPAASPSLVGDLLSVWFSWQPGESGPASINTDNRNMVDVYSLEAADATSLWGADANVLGWELVDIGGSGSSGASLSAVRSYLIDTYLAGGLGPYGKFFDGGSGWHAAYSNFNNSGYGDAPNERHPVICSKVHTTASFNALMTDMAAALPVGETWYACFFSEPEDDFNASTLTYTQYQDAWASMNTLRAAHPHGDQVKFIPILMAYQEISGSQHWSDFLTPVLAVADAIGWDVYDDNGDPQSWSFEDDIYPAILDLQAASGLPWSIPEYGLQVSTHSGSTDTAAGVLARWEAMVAVCNADANFLWGNYWMDGPHAANQRSAVIRTDSDNADYLTALVAGDIVDPAVGDWADLVPAGSGLGTVVWEARTTETYAIRVYPLHDTDADTGLHLLYSFAAGTPVTFTTPVSVITSPDVLSLSFIDQPVGADISFTYDGGETVITVDVIDADGTWDGGVPIPELDDGDHYLTALIGSASTNIPFTVANDVTYHSSPTDPADPTLPDVVGGEWVAP